MEKSDVLLLVFVLSEFAAVFLIWGIWNRQDSLLIKISMSATALIPVVGVLGVLWVYGFPPAKHRALQNRGLGYIPTAEVFDRWRHVFDEKSEQKRKQETNRLLSEHSDEQD